MIEHKSLFYLDQYQRLNNLLQLQEYYGELFQNCRHYLLMLAHLLKVNVGDVSLVNLHVNVVNQQNDLSEVVPLDGRLLG